MNDVKKVTDQINWSLVVTLVVAALAISVVYWGMGKSGIKLVKEVAKAK